MYLKALKLGLSKGGVDLKIGEEFETDDASGASLVDDGYAEENTDRVEAPNSPEKVEGLQTPAEDLEGGQMVSGQSTGSENGEGNGADQEDGQKEPEQNAGGADQEAELTKVRKVLDDQYKRAELYEAAKTAGVDIAYDAKKADIVEAVITQGKVVALLK